MDCKLNIERERAGPEAPARKNNNMSKNRRAQHTRHGGPALLQLVVFPMLNYPKLTMFEYQTIAGESFFSFLNRSA